MDRTHSTVSASRVRSITTAAIVNHSELPFGWSGETFLMPGSPASSTKIAYRGSYMSLKPKIQRRLSSSAWLPAVQASSRVRGCTQGSLRPAFSLEVPWLKAMSSAWPPPQSKPPRGGSARRGIPSIGVRYSRQTWWVRSRISSISQLAAMTVRIVPGFQ